MAIISVRFAAPSDAASVLSIYGPYCESSWISFEIVAPTLSEMQGRIERIGAQYPWLVCEIDGDLAGYVYASQHRERAAYRWAVDVAVYIGERFQRSGVARGLYTALFAILREQGYFTAHAGIALPNEKSVGLHEAMGFRPVGVCPRVGFKLGRWLDVGWWQLTLRPETLEPPEPLAIGDLRENLAVRAVIVDCVRLMRGAVIASSRD